MSEPLSDFTGSVSPKTVSINNVQFHLREFDMRTRALWLNVAKEYGLSEAQHEIQSKVIPRISGITNDLQTDPRLKSLERRLDKLSEKHDKLLELYATPEEPEGLEDELEAIVARMEATHEEMSKMAEAIQGEVFLEAQSAEKSISEFMELQDKARIDFAHRLATALGKTQVEFDEFYAKCDGDDYAAAERFVNEGNAPWASLYESRMQQKPKKTKLPN